MTTNERRKPHSITNHDVRDMREYFAKGMSPYEISLRIGCERKTVIVYVKYGGDWRAFRDREKAKKRGHPGPARTPERRRQLYRDRKSKQ